MYLPGNDAVCAQCCVGITRPHVLCLFFERKGRVDVALMLYMYNADVKVSSFASFYRAERSR